MLERGWKLESAELLGVAGHEARRRSRCRRRARAARRAATRSPGTRTSRSSSWLWLRGRCSACKTPISARYPLVEAAHRRCCSRSSAGASAPTPAALLWCGFCRGAGRAGQDRLGHHAAARRPDAAAAVGRPRRAPRWAGRSPLPTRVWGAVAGYLSLWAVYWLFKLTTGKEGMGYGDFKLLAALGAWLGWQMILPIVLGASVIGAVVGIAMKLSAARCAKAATCPSARSSPAPALVGHARRARRACSAGSAGPERDVARWRRCASA